MSPDEFRSIIITMVKLGGIVFAVIHFFIGVILFRHISKMRSIIKTSVGGVLTFIELAHVVLLAIVILLIFFIKV